MDTWTDKSSSHNNAATANASQKPAVVTGAGAINGRQALRFDGATSFFTIADNASIRFTQSFVMEAVFRHAAAVASEDLPIYNKQTGAVLTNPKGPALLIGSGLTNPYPSYIEGLAQSNLFLDTDKVTGFAAGVHRTRMAWDLGTTTLTLQVDKDAASTGVKAGVTGLDATGHDALIGKDLDGNFLKGDLAELVILTGAKVADADVTQLQAYLDKKYGL